jgi:hypothetical protein
VPPNDTPARPTPRRRIGASLGVGVGLLALAGAAPLASGQTPPGIGYDISFPQCGRPFPVGAAFTIVGVNGGRPFTANPCLGAGADPSELAWGGVGTALYVNTANPGPSQTTRWPVGQASPQECATPANPGADTLACAYDYGWNAGADAYATAVAAYRSLGWAPPGATTTPVANVWWLDVERANSWRADTARNVAALQGEVDYLRAARAAAVGLYSVAGDWRTITGNTTAFGTLPSWVAGPATQSAALALCGGPGFTGGGVALVQFPSGGFDGNVRCATPAPPPPVAPPPSGPPLAFAGAPPGLRAGGVSAIGLALGAPALAPVPLTIASSAPSGAFAPTPAGPWSARLTVTVPLGATGAGVYYRDVRAGRPRLTVTAPTGASASEQATVAAAALAVLRISPAGARLRRGGAQGYRAIGRDRYGNPVRTAVRWGQSPALGRLLPTVSPATRLVATRLGAGVLTARAHGVAAGVRFLVARR